jgi:hypothetical protein
VSLKQARQKWLDNTTIDFCVAIANFKQAEDRKALCAYALTGELLKADVGSVVMWSLPKDYIGYLSMNENIFQASDFMHLMETRLKCGNIMEAAVKYLRNGVNKLSRFIRDKSLVVELNFKIVSLEQTKTIQEIRALNAWTISWSNICDYFQSTEFHKMARACSGEDTIHFGYSMNWPKQVFGASILDFRFNTKEGGEYFDWLIETENHCIEEFYEILKCKSVLHCPAVADARNLAEGTLYLWFKKYWVDYFFSKNISGIESISKQVLIYKTMYTIFTRTSSTVFFMYSYDPECSLKGTSANDF